MAGILHAKESKHFEAKDKLIIKYGNIGVVRIKVNGEAVDLKGRAWRGRQDLSAQRSRTACSRS